MHITRVRRQIVRRTMNSVAHRSLQPAPSGVMRRPLLLSKLFLVGNATELTPMALQGPQEIHQCVTSSQGSMGSHLHRMLTSESRGDSGAGCRVPQVRSGRVPEVATGGLIAGLSMLANCGHRRWSDWDIRRPTRISRSLARGAKMSHSYR